MTGAPVNVPSRLARHLGLGDAVTIGLGSMIGAGVFAAVGPAALAAGSGLLIGLLIAAVVAFCNATSSAALAAVHPASGGTYVYGREHLGPFWGYLAGWGFVVGKLASCAAVALTVGAYAAPSVQRPVAIAAVVALTTVNLRGVRKTAALTRIIVAIVLAALALVVAGALLGGQASTSRFGSLGEGGVVGILQSAGVLFFAFAGYARIATLGEEVVDPARTIPRAIPIALGITLVVYAIVAVSALAAVGPEALAGSDAPLATAARPVTSTGSCPPCGSAAPSQPSVSCCHSSPGSAEPRSRWPPTASCPPGSPPSIRSTRSPIAPKSSPVRSSSHWSQSPTCAVRSASVRSVSSPTTPSPTHRPGPCRPHAVCGRVASPCSVSSAAPPSPSPSPR